MGGWHRGRMERERSSSDLGKEDLLNMNLLGENKVVYLMLVNSENEYEVYRAGKLGKSLF